MTGIGVVIFFVGYATVYWGVNAFGGTQPTYTSLIFPFGQ